MVKRNTITYLGTLLSLFCVSALGMQIHNKTGHALSCLKIADPTVRHCGLQIPNQQTHAIHLRQTRRFVVMLQTQTIWPAKINIVKKGGLLGGEYCYPKTLYHCHFNGPQEVTIEANY